MSGSSMTHTASLQPCSLWLVCGLLILEGCRFNSPSAGSNCNAYPWLQFIFVSPDYVSWIIELSENILIDQFIFVASLRFLLFIIMRIETNSGGTVQMYPTSRAIFATQTYHASNPRSYSGNSMSSSYSSRRTNRVYSVSYLFLFFCRLYHHCW